MATRFDDWEGDFLAHHGIKGQKWGIRRFQNPDGTLTEAGKKRRSGEVMFVSGSSKTQDKTSAYYRRKLPKYVRNALKGSIRNGDTIVVGDAPGIDRQVQDYLKKKKYGDVEVYGPGNQVRYAADKRWKTNTVNDPKHKEGPKEWLEGKDKAMTDRATKGLAVVLDEGSSATRKNVRRLINQNKNVRIYEIHANVNTLNGKKLILQGFKNPADQEVIYSFDTSKNGKTREENAVYVGTKHERRRPGRL